MTESYTAPNKPAAPNPAVASRLHAGRHRRGVGEPGRWAALIAHMRFSALIVIVSLVTFGCASTKRSVGPQGVSIAVNLGFEHDRELEPIQKALIVAGVSCEQCAMSCNEAPLLVKPQDFQLAKTIATDTVIRDSLTVRLYKSPSSSSLLEVWESGQKTREEPHKLYPLTDETISSIKALEQTGRSSQDEVAQPSGCRQGRDCTSVSNRTLLPRPA